MNQFKKSLKENTSKSIDEKISANISSELEKLERELKKEEDKQNIRQVKQGVKQVLVSFDGSMELIEKNKGFRVIKPGEERKVNGVEKVLQKRIWERLEKLYQYTMRYGTFDNEEERDKELRQILDRQIRLRILLEQYEENMDIITSSKTIYPNHQIVL